MGIGRHRNRRSVPAVVAGRDFTFGRTIVPVLFTVIRDADGSTVDTVVGGGNFTFGRTVVPVFFAVIGNVHAFSDMAVVGVGYFADRGTWRGIIFGAAVRPFVNPGRTDAAGIFAPARSARYRARRGTVGRVVYIFAFADAGLIFSAAAGSLSDLI